MLSHPREPDSSSLPQALALPDALRTDLARAVQILKAAGCSAVYLFGSVASGNMHASSDIDLAISGCSSERYFSLLGQLLAELEHPVDLIDLDTVDPFVRRLHASGKLVRIG